MVPGSPPPHGRSRSRRVAGVAQDPKPQSVTSAWVQGLRREVIATGNRDIARVAQVGVWMSTFANADGTSITAGQKTIALLTAMSVESVSRAIKVLVGLGLLRSRRRPNQNTEYILTLPVGPLEWQKWLPFFTETRQKIAHRARKAADLEQVIAKTDTVRGGSPDTVRGGSPNGLTEDPDTVRGRGRTPSVDGVRTPSVAGGTMSHLPPVVTSTENQDTVAHLPQPQVGGAARERQKIILRDESGWQAEPTRCTRCGGRMAARHGYTECAACRRDQAAAGTGPSIVV